MDGMMPTLLSPSEPWRLVHALVRMVDAVGRCLSTRPWPDHPR
jgi:hypothetical protein